MGWKVMMQLGDARAIYLKLASLKTKLGVLKFISQYSIFMHIGTECTLARACSFAAFCLHTPYCPSFPEQRVPLRQLFPRIMVGFEVWFQERRALLFLLSILLVLGMGLSENPQPCFDSLCKYSSPARHGICPYVWQIACEINDEWLTVIYFGWKHITIIFANHQ